MKKIALCLIVCAILNIFTSNKILASASSHSEIVIDFQTGRVLLANNETQKRLIASTTKILTAICAIENCDVKKSVVIKREWCEIEGSSVYLKEGDVYTIEQLLYGLMLRSGNDCAVAIACAVSNSVKNFCVLMNEVAKSAGANCSSFCNPHGLDDESHYSTAKDLALITRYALKNLLFKKIVSTKKYRFELNGETVVWQNKNKLLSYCDDAIGVKTGYTKKSGRCLVSAIERNGQILICVVLGLPNTYERTEYLFEEAEKQYEYVRLLGTEKSVANLQFDKGSSVPCFVKEDFYYPLTQEEKKKIEYVVNFDKNIKIPLKFEQNVGTIQILLEKQLLFEQKIYTII